MAYDKPHHRFPALDGWRAVGALMVILSHLYFGFFDWLGELGVEIFFVISGYIICAGLLREEAQFTRIYLKGFYVRRAFRILPPLVLYIATLVALATVGLLPDYSMLAARALLFSCDLQSVNCGGWFGAHTWSLSVEEQFYAVIPLLFIWLGSSRRRVTLTVGALCLPIAVLFLFALKLTATAVFISKFITIGCGVACALNETIVRRIITALPSGSLGLIIVALLVVGPQSGSRAATAVHALMVGPLIVCALMRTLTTRSVMSRTLSSAPFAAFGLVSYSLYLWQQLAIWPAIRYGNTLVAIAALVGCVMFCFVSYFLVERRLIALGRELAVTMRHRSRSC